eukprot:2864824-Pyramimonas_sp.AAC.1
MHHCSCTDRRLDAYGAADAGEAGGAAPQPASVPAPVRGQHRPAREGARRPAFRAVVEEPQPPAGGWI